MAVVAVASLGLLALVLGGAWAEAAAVAMVVVLIATPLLRVLWLVGRWFGRGDYRYAMVGVVVLLIPVAGFALSR